jgi:hypothetical protein
MAIPAVLTGVYLSLIAILLFWMMSALDPHHLIYFGGVLTRPPLPAPPGGMTMIVTSKGYTPITLAIIYCKREHGGGEVYQHGQDLGSGAFTGLSAMDVAVNYGNKGVVSLLHHCRTTASAQGHW